MRRNPDKGKTQKAVRLDVHDFHTVVFCSFALCCNPPERFTDRSFLIPAINSRLQLSRKKKEIPASLGQEFFQSLRTGIVKQAPAWCAGSAFNSDRCGQRGSLGKHQRPLFDRGYAFHHFLH